MQSRKPDIKVESWARGRYTAVFGTGHGPILPHRPAQGRCEALFVIYTAPGLADQVTEYIGAYGALVTTAPSALASSALRPGDLLGTCG